MAIEKLTGSKPPLQVQNIQSHSSETGKKSVTSQLIEKRELIKQYNKEDLEKAVTTLNEFLKPKRTNLRFELHDKLNKYFVKVVDSESNEVIKEIPPKKMLDMYAAIADFLGFLIDKKI